MRLISKAIWVAAGAVFLCPSVTWAQARSRYQFNTPTLHGLRTVGGRFATDTAGLGGLVQSSPGGGGDLLRSSLQVPSGGYSPLSSSAASGLMTTGLPDAGTLTGMSYGAVSTRAESLADLSSLGRVNLNIDAFGNLDAYLVALGHTLETSRSSGETITSFVPVESSRYRDFMLEADKAFREGKYIQANDQLAVAMALSRDAPELNLNLVLSNLSLGRYHSAVFHLQKALTVFPELPLVKMDLRAFYGKKADEQGQGGRTADFDQHRDDLLTELEQSGPDEKSWLLLAAYLDYFSGSEGKVPATLRKAYLKARTRDDQATIKAVSIFWDGMFAAGKVAGKVDPSAPDEPVPPASRPAGAADQAARGAPAPGTLGATPSAPPKDPPAP